MILFCLQYLKSYRKSAGVFFQFEYKIFFTSIMLNTYKYSSVKQKIVSFIVVSTKD